MDQSSPSNGSSRPAPTTLESQLREMYGRAAYTHKTHEKMADGYIGRYRVIKTVEIVLSAAAASSLLIAILGDSKLGTVVGAVLSTVLLGLTLYFKEASLGEQAQKHTVVASKLWGVRETLLSLLVDMHDGRPTEDVRAERDRLNELLEDIYKGAPRTDSKAYAAAQKALKDSEELFFTDDELDKLLPKRLRHRA
ncbi:SLATT domain-containing protein [Hydrogenophaga sp.]|uniref:SLATT domain-containing protein n=1 Tax=Hydrogenophaga sp. TaxID=1904254 RepID=UPI00272192D6|nr:SLATT domain-containing protein [Hydrogenophaga sp.]MDO9437720.1 SLATT domain-containing protein [Hydrogenophaga sp.]